MKFKSHFKITKNENLNKGKIIMRFGIIGLIIFFIQTNVFSVEKSDFYLGTGFRIISSDIAKYAKHPIQLQLGYIHDIMNSQFNIGVEAQGGLGGSSNESGESEFVAFWKLQLDTRYDFKVQSKKFIPYLNVGLSLFNVGFENTVHEDALAVDNDGGVYESGTKFFPSVGGGVLFVLPNEDKIGLNLEYTYSNYDFIIAEGNPLNVGFSAEYLF